MAEDVDLFKPTSGHHSTFRMEKVPQRLIDGAETKHIIKLEKSGRKISLVRRSVGSSSPRLIGFSEKETELSPAENYVFGVNILRQRGIPVVETARVINDDEVAVTDESADGSYVFDLKSEQSKIYFPEEYGPHDTSHDAEILAIPEKELATKIQEVFNNASQNGVEMPIDSMEHIILKPDGSWQLKVLDITFCKIWKNPEDPNIKKDDYLKKINDNQANSWIYSFGLFKEQIKELS